MLLKSFDQRNESIWEFGISDEAERSSWDRSESFRIESYRVCFCRWFRQRFDRNLNSTNRSSSTISSSIEYDQKHWDDVERRNQRVSSSSVFSNLIDLFLFDSLFRPLRIRCDWLSWPSRTLSKCVRAKSRHGIEIRVNLKSNEETND